MATTGDCPTCGAPVTSYEDWNPENSWSNSYYYNEEQAKAQQDKIKALRARVKKLEARLAKSKVTCNRLWAKNKETQCLTPCESSPARSTCHE